jgi:hypothetical protein
VLNVIDSAAEEYVQSVASSSAQQAPQRPPSFTTSMVVLTSPEGVYCFRAPMALHVDAWDLQDGDDDDEAEDSDAASGSSGSKQKLVLLESWDGFGAVFNALEVLVTGGAVRSSSSSSSSSSSTSSSSESPSPSSSSSSTATATEWNDLLTTAYARVFQIDVAPAMFSDLRTRLVPPPQFALPRLVVTPLGPVSAELVTVNRQALLFNTDRCWAPDCTLKTSPAHLPSCGACKIAKFCSKECQVTHATALWIYAYN